MRIEGGVMIVNVRRLVVTAIFIALALGLKFALIILPNVEPLTVTFFLAGYMLGPLSGLITGGIGEFLYSFFNPYGAASPPLLMAQVLCMSLSGLAGGWVRRLSSKRTPPAWLWGVIGFFFDADFRSRHNSERGFHCEAGPRRFSFAAGVRQLFLCHTSLDEHCAVCSIVARPHPAFAITNRISKPATCSSPFRP